MAKLCSSSIFNLLGASKLLSIATAIIYIPANSEEETRVPFIPHLHQHLFFVFLIIAILADEVVSHWDFDYHLPGDLWCWAFFFFLMCL